MKQEPARAARREAPPAARPAGIPVVHGGEDVNWKERAACLTISNPDIFYPPTKGREQWIAPRGVCGGCTVVAECLREALMNDEPFGMWGGMTPDERRLLGGR